ncbi:hypothetical protein [Pseudomonas sp. GCEP-101]|uniref:hypothetical protein n=1 Tax=Pseudomonas sp. GCEP-101 TaxID=2974552 RepID=UPI00223B2E41|nr:hypothetical protein [Pseudomonas sp. GCEP-101]
MDSFYRYYLAQDIHPVDDSVLDKAVESLEGTAVKFSLDAISDAAQRENYNKNIRRVVEDIKAEVKAGRVSVKEAAEFCYEMRNKIMAETRARTSAQGLAIAERRKRVPPSLDELLDKYSMEKYKKKFAQLSVKQKSTIHYTIVESSARADALVNTTNKVLRVAGKVTIVVTIIYAGYEIANADNKTKETIKQAGTIGGGFAGTLIASALVSTVCGPGAPVCTIALMLAGGAIGGLAASSTLDYFDEELEEFTKWQIS